MKAKVVVLRQEAATARAKAEALGLPVEVREGWELTAERTMFLAPEGDTDWRLVPHGFHFVERWDLAVPLWRYGVLAKDVGSPSERARTEAVVRDLRVLLYAHELMFVRDSEAGRAFLAALEEEEAGGGEMRLAFLRALYRVKPRLCALPRTWVPAVRERAEQDARAVSEPDEAGLVRVEVKPRLFIKCRPGEEEYVLRQYQERRSRRGRR